LVGFGLIWADPEAGRLWSAMNPMSQAVGLQQNKTGRKPRALPHKR